MRIIVLLCISALTLTSYGQYSADGIGEDLTTGANAVFRLKESTFIIHSTSSATFKVRNIVTILNKKGDDQAVFAVGYDKLRKLKTFSGIAYDAKGEVIQKLKKDQIVDQSSISGFSLYEDNRVRAADLSQSEYPYTVEYQFEVQYKYLYGIPSWKLYYDEHVSVEHAKFSIEAPGDLLPRYRLINTDLQPEKVSSDATTKLIWEFNNQPAVEREPLSKGLGSISPIVDLSPTKFSFEGYDGDMSTWEGVSRWQMSLNKDRDEISDKTRQEVKKLLSDSPNKIEKVKRVYEYMQNRTRYVSIQLGIGGLQPFEAKVVDEYGYGDCKALTFYTQALLKSVGIKSYYTLIEAGPNPVDLSEDFPYDSFNHVVLCVPNDGDTLWLECTSQVKPMGYMGKFTGDRKAFVITEDGGKIAKTPSYEYENNKIVTTAIIDLDSEGDGIVHGKINFYGLAYDYNDIDNTIRLPEEKQKNWLKRNIEIPNYEIQDYNFTEHKGLIPSIDLDLKMTVRSVASKGGKRLFLNPNLMSQLSYVPKDIEERKSNVFIPNSSIHKDSLIYKLSDGLSVENIPDKLELVSKFGKYSSEIVQADDQIIYKREMILHKGEYPAVTYADLVDFFKKIRKLDKRTIVLVTSDN